MNFILRIAVAVVIAASLPWKSSAASVSFDLAESGSALQPEHLAGTCLPIWNNASTYNEIKAGLSQSNYRLFRFPNGSLSNGYHWNGTGSYTADSIWVCDSTNYSAGFMGMTLLRGTSVSNWGFDSYSNITDGDTATWWRSDELIIETPPYFYLELSKTAVVDSIVVVWGGRYAVDFDVDFFTRTNCPYPGPFGYPEDLWENQKAITNNDQPVFSDTISGGKSARHVRVRIKKFRDTEKSVEVKEVYLFSKGVQISKNVKIFTGGGADNQTKVIAMPTFIGNIRRPGTAGWKSWHFESFMTYIQSISDSSIPVICVNYGTGTPEEAAAWVYYANIVKKYNVKFWEIGNELDGEWEDGGPVTAGMYAEKFLRFSRAMKKVDSTIKVFGPLLSNAAFDESNSGLYDGKSWMKAFIDIVGAAEKTDGRKYCDGIDFHSYPYWDNTVNATRMLESVDYLHDQTDSLRGWIDSALVTPESVFVMMSEFNSMTILSDLLQKPINGLFVANMYAGLAEKFGSRAMSVFWDSFEEGDVGSDNTFGSLSLFNKPGSRFRSSLTKAPSAAYWALFTAQNLWIDREKDNSAVHAVVDTSGSIRAYGLASADDFRALVFNFSTSPDTVSCTPAGGDFDSVDVFTWGGSHFFWTGSDKYAYAFPNCGPASKTYATNDFKNIVMPGLSMCVLRYRDTAAAKQAPRFLHLMHTPYTDTGLILPLCGTAHGGGTAVASVDYSFDSAKTFSLQLKSIDGAFDGPLESFFDSISLRGLTSGQHKLYLRLRSTAGDTAIDSVTFSVSSLAVHHPRQKTIVNGWNIAVRKSCGRISLAIASPAGSRNVPVFARVFSLNGACVRTLASTGENERATINWTGAVDGNRKAAPGVYFIIVTAGREIIYRTTAIIGR